MLNILLPSLALIDWVNAVFIPIAISLTIGVALSIWTGLIAGRYVEFKQALRDALEIFMSPDHLFLKGDDATIGKNNMLRLQARIGRVFNDQGQFAVHDVFEKLCSRLEVAQTELLRNVAAAGTNSNARKQAFEGYLAATEPLLRELKQIPINLPALIIGRKLNTLAVLGAYHFENFCEYLENGRPLAEIHERRQREKR